MAQGLVPVEDMQSNVNSAYYWFVGSAKHLGLEPFRHVQGVDDFPGEYLNRMLEDSVLTWPEYYTIIAFQYLLGDEHFWTRIQREYRIAPAIHATLVHWAGFKDWEAQFENGSFYVEEDFCSRLAGLLANILEPIQKRLVRLDGLKPCTYQHPIDRKIIRYVSNLPGCEALCAKTVNVMWRQKELAMMDMISWFIALLDGTAIVTRRALKSCWKWLRENLLGYRGTYVQKGPSQWIEQTEFNSIEGSLVTERVLSSDEVPAAIRNEAIKHNQSSFVIDQKSILEEQARKVAQRAGMEDVLVTEV